MAPTVAGYDYRASGGSRLGPFTSNGQILLPKGGRTTIAIAALDVMGTTARGNLRADPGGFTGKLTLAGGGMAGNLLFSPVGGDQKIEAHLTANGVRFAGPPALSVQSGRIDGTILLAEGATSMDGVVVARGLAERGDPAVAADRQRQIGQRARRGARGDGRAARQRVRVRHLGQCRARADHDQRARPGRPQAVRAGQRGGADARRRRLADRPDRCALRRRAGAPQRPHRVAARNHRRCQPDAARLARHDLARSRPGRDRDRAGAICVGGRERRAGGPI